jgi:osmotically-inducible protein OsmY
MTTGLLTSTDLLLRDHVVHQLARDSQVDASEIGVAAHAGAVTLTGFINSYAGKLAAERAAKRVRGVRAVANGVEVRLRLPRTDPEIAAEVVQALGLRVTLPESVQAVVHHGHVVLTGTVSSLFHKAVAEKALRHIPGVVGIANRITVAPDGTTRDVKRHIVSALHRDADVDDEVC